MSFAIRVEDLSKQYQLGARERPRRTLRDELAHAIQHPLCTVSRVFAGEQAEAFWALKGLNLEVEQGEVLGVIGRNGAGKSTFLKILSRITDPTRGRALVRGRLASLLEVGTGFHPELSGRENIFLNATVLGMRRAEISKSFDEIVAFSGVEKFLDSPVKHYSSGMYVRLAFAVAAHVQADVLLVDEVLAVGDAEFQRRCLGKMGEVARSGRTVLLVSHALDTIGKLCQRTLWLDSGELRAIDASASVLSKYLNWHVTPAPTWTPVSDEFGVVVIRSVRVLNDLGDMVEEVRADRSFSVEFDYVAKDTVTGRLAILIRDESGVAIINSASTDAGSALNERMNVGSFRTTCTVPGNLLNPGTYAISVAVPDGDGEHRVFDSVVCVKVSTIGSLTTRDGRRGAIAPLLAWTVGPL